MRLLRLLLFLISTPIALFSQEFYPGSLESIDNPICYETSILLSFDALPSNSENNNYYYTWQKSWNGLNWFNIDNSNSTTHTTENLDSDTYYRVNVTYENTSLPTNEIVVYVLPELNSGILSQNCMPNSGTFNGSCADTVCLENSPLLEFETMPSGAELSWGGFSEFTYQWQKNNTLIDQVVAGEIVNIIPNEDDWIDVGEDNNIYLFSEAGLCFFRCIISSPYGCGSAVTEPVAINVINCSNTVLNDSFLNKALIVKTSIIGQQNARNNNIIISIYDDGSIEKKYIVK